MLLQVIENYTLHIIPQRNLSDRITNPAYIQEEENGGFNYTVSTKGQTEVGLSLIFTFNLQKAKEFMTSTSAQGPLQSLYDINYYFLSIQKQKLLFLLCLFNVYLYMS